MKISRRYARLKPWHLSKFKLRLTHGQARGTLPFGLLEPNSEEHEVTPLVRVDIGVIGFDHLEFGDQAETRKPYFGTRQPMIGEKSLEIRKRLPGFFDRRIAGFCPASRPNEQSDGTKDVQPQLQVGETRKRNHCHIELGIIPVGGDNFQTEGDIPAQSEVIGQTSDPSICESSRIRRRLPSEF